ncbi:MAG: S9 family peptidase [Candidatus Heimdallarchaeota archaeon]|nr:MAG: S9 family peptidase [Candidatus Heimdallarchaeota archaeon]
MKIIGKDRYKRFTSGTHVDTAPQFSPSGKYLAFLSSRVEEGMQVFIMSVDGGEAVQVTKFPQGIMSFNWSNDSNSLHVIARVNEEDLDVLLNSDKDKAPSYVLEPVEFKKHKSKKEEMKVMRADPRVISEGYCREGTSYLDGFTQPFIINISEFDHDDQEELCEVIHIGEMGFHYSLGVFNLDDSAIFTSRFKEDPAITIEQDILRIDVDNPKERKLVGTAFGWVNNFQLSPDGKFVSFEAKRKDKTYDNEQIFLVKASSNELEEFICVTEDYDRSAVQSLWFDDHTLLFLSPSNGRINIHKIDIESREVESVVEGDRNINSFTLSTNKRRIAYAVSHVSFPSDIFWCENDGSNERRITEANKEYLNSHLPTKYEAFTYTRDGQNFQGWLLLPNGVNQPEQKMPVILEIHGGPAVMWTPHEITLWHEWNVMTSQGYAVVFCNPRGSDGYGIDFRASVFKNWGSLPAGDILKGLDTALEKYSFLDSDRVAVTGGSYGGYMTSWLVTQTNRFKAAVSQRGVYEFISFSMTTDIPIWFEKQYEGETIEKFTEIWEDFPVAHIKKLQTPLLIIHSENDFRAPIINAEQLFWLGKRYGKTVEFVRYPRDGHELSRSGEPRHIIDRINRLIGWIQKYIGN